MGKNGIFSAHFITLGTILGRESARIDRQRLVLLLCCYLPVTILGIVAIFAGITGPTSSFFNCTHAGFLVAVTISLALYFAKRISVAACLSACTIIGQVTLTVEMIHLSCAPDQYSLMLIVANTVLLALNTMVSMAALLETNTLILGIASIATYIACTVISGDETLRNFLVLFVISFAVVGAVGLLVSRSIRDIEEENSQLRRDEAELLTILRIRKDDIKTYLSLASKKHSGDDAWELIENLDKKARYNLLANVEEYIRNRDTSRDAVEKAFPELTPSEREICRLVLQGKKLGEICVMLDKKESNINSQRANIRRKLGLRPSDNLLAKLQEKMDKS